MFASRPIARDSGAQADRVSKAWSQQIGNDPVVQRELASFRGGQWQRAQLFLQFARSAPGLASAVVGHKQLSHVQQNLQVAAHRPLSTSALARLLQFAYPHTAIELGAPEAPATPACSNADLCNLAAGPTPCLFPVDGHYYCCGEAGEWVDLGPALPLHGCGGATAGHRLKPESGGSLSGSLSERAGGVSSGVVAGVRPCPHLLPDGATISDGARDIFVVVGNVKFKIERPVRVRVHIVV